MRQSLPPNCRLVEVRFEDRFDHQLGCGLHHPIPDGGYPERSLTHAAGLRNHHPSHRLRTVASCSHLLPQLAQPAGHAIRLDLREGDAVHTRRPTVLPAERECMGEDVFTPYLVVQDMEPPNSILLGRRVQRPLEPPEFRGGCQAHANPPPLGSSKRTPNQGPFPPLALPSFLSTMGPSDACLARPPKRLVPGRPGRTTGLPCCQSPRAYVLRPLPRQAERSSCVGRSDRPRRPSSNERRLGARIQPFGACSGFTRVAARTLADTPKAELCPRGFAGSVALAVSRVATKVYRHLLGPDFHRLRCLTLHGTLSFLLAERASLLRACVTGAVAEWPSSDLSVALALTGCL